MKAPPENLADVPRSTWNAGRATLLRCTGKLQRKDSVIHIVADRFDA